jgi:hypothetical protein
LKLFVENGDRQHNHLPRKRLKIHPIRHLARQGAQIHFRSAPASLPFRPLVPEALVGFTQKLVSSAIRLSSARRAAQIARPRSLSMERSYSLAKLGSQYQLQRRLSLHQRAMERRRNLLVDSAAVGPPSFCIVMAACRLDSLRALRWNWSKSPTPMIACTSNAIFSISLNLV